MEFQRTDQYEFLNFLQISTEFNKIVEFNLLNFAFVLTHLEYFYILFMVNIFYIIAISLTKHQSNPYILYD